MNTDIVDTAFQKLVDSAYKVDKRLGDSLLKKYEDDRKSFLEAVELSIEGREKVSWAKSSCKKCYGTGIIGVRGNKELHCQCIQKEFLKWLKVFRTDYLRNKGHEKTTS